MEQELTLKITEDLLKKLENMKVSIGDKDYVKLIGRSLGLLEFINEQRCKGYTQIICKNPNTGRFYELMNNFWKEKE